MTLKRYWLGDGALALPRADGHLCYFEDVEAYVKAQRADAQREALEYIRGWCNHGLACTWMSQAYHCACEDMRLHIDAALEQLAAGERIESVSQVDGGGE